jgi:hypothetical protein
MYSKKDHKKPVENLTIARNQEVAIAVYMGTEAPDPSLLHHFYGVS